MKHQFEAYFQFSINTEGLNPREESVAFHRIDTELRNSHPLIVTKKEGYADRFMSWNECGLVIGQHGVEGQAPTFYNDLDLALKEFKRVLVYLESHYGEDKVEGEIYGWLYDNVNGKDRTILGLYIYTPQCGEFFTLHYHEGDNQSGEIGFDQVVIKTEYVGEDHG